ncbi:MAG: efflux RND transporter periplasmic adaptor subunit [Candidatus Accumulibacter sp.]|uniref:efflux RND transporter periplasmic adaptor subunit n=1 Tax=Accumulibacter sp. TaxID=2053492 RepID=UPI0025828F97|nr:efflux RND transporter periplasmic adaptor subunit [Accumulibacter sp.]MBK8114130.1 efflux RND transporter periplasmic adaptor subunit [Accumulibacter sp.]
MTRSRMLMVAAMAAVVGAGYWYYSTRNATSGGTAKVPPPVPVTVAQANLGDVPVLLDVVGRAEAYESVTLKSRLDGQVAAVPYTEGQHVRQGEVLVQLDAGDFDARLLQAEANLARNEALMAKARADVTRYLALQGRGFVSEEKVNELRTAEAAAAATLKADQAAVELARRQISYTTIRAPFAGVVGARLVFPGSAVKINDTALAVVNRIRPLYVTFSVPEKHLPRLRKAISSGEMRAGVTIPGDREQRFEATVRFIDNTVDTATGTILMKALLENREEKLTPGQFLNVSMSLDTLAKAVVVPAEAVQQGPEGNFLFVVRPDNTVEPRKIEVQASYRGLAAIGKGVAAGETVVTDGQLRLTPGALVQARPAQQKTE